MQGLVVLDKAAGVSSHDALRPVKRAVGRGIKVGHAGTLDPFATGVLLALLGRATRLSDVAMGLKKTYEATVRFGIATDTHDPEGRVTAETDPGTAPPSDIEAALAAFEGEIAQVPPAFSALKVNGRRAYRLARDGEAPALEARRVTVHGIRLIDVAWPAARIEVTCGAGTYIRSIARDLGAALGLPAHLTDLRRTAVGPFAASTGLTGEPDLPAIRDALVPPLDVVRAAGLPEVPLDPDAAALFRVGQRIETESAPADPVAVVSAGALLGIGRVEETGSLSPVRVFAVAEGSA